MPQAEFCKLLLGTWTGERTGPELGREQVKAVWELTLDGSFLRESWFTSGRTGTLGLDATAFFRVHDGSPAEFFVVYSGGRMGMGRSEVSENEWSLLHEWFNQPPEQNEIRIRLEGDDSYRQEVRRVGQSGATRLVNQSILFRRRDI